MRILKQSLYFDVYMRLLALVFICMSFSGCHIKSEDYADHVFSHRGTAKEAIEHTFEAYDLAISYGTHFLELDIVTSSNGTLYVSHDLSAKKITGIDRAYAEMNDNEISLLRTSNGEPIHTVQEVFDRYGNEVAYLVELKEGWSQIELFQEVIQNNTELDIIVQARDISILENLDITFPRMKKLAICSDDMFDAALKSEAVDIISGDAKLISSQDVITEIQANGKQANVFTINTEEEITQYIQWGIDNYFTDYTGRALKLERMYRNL